MTKKTPIAHRGERPTRIRRSLQGLALATAALAEGAAMARVDVADIASERIAAEVGASGYTLVLLSSPDPKCGFCRGQAEVFDAFARSYGGSLRMRRVQWQPWRSFPPWNHIPAQIYGVPSWLLFKDGQALALEGRLQTEAAVQKFLDDAMAGRLPKPQPASPPAPAGEAEAKAAAARQARATPPPDAPLTPEQHGALSRWVQGELGREALKKCTQAHPAEAAGYERALERYRSAHAAALQQGAQLVFTRTGPNAADEMRAITAAETSRLAAKAPMRTLDAPSCRQLAEAMAP